MNIIQKLTLLHLKENKKQTFITLVGVILSVTMITAVATSCVSFLDLLQRRAIETDGNWHVLYEAVSKEALPILLEDENTKKAFVSSSLGHAWIEGGYNASKPYLEVLAMNEESLEAYPITLIEGKFPTNSTEVLVTKSVMNASDLTFNIGDTFTIEVGQRLAENGELKSSRDSYYEIFKEQLIDLNSYTFTVVGFVSQSDAMILSGPSYPLITAMDEALVQKVDKVTVAMQLHHLTPSLYSHATSLIDEAQVSFNRELLRYSGVTSHSDMNLMLYGLAGFFMILIMVASVSVIYNAFSISAAKRTKHLGMLASVGATKAQKRGAILFEGFAIGLVGIPIGLLVGTLGMGITFFFISPFFETAANLSLPLQLVISPASIWMAIFVSSLTILISGWIPAYRASKVSPMIAIRQNKEIKLDRRSIKNSKWISHFFGIEGDLALKNIKRQKRRYHSTIFSLVLSIVLFLVTQSFLQQLQQAYSLTQTQENYDLAIYGASPTYGYSFGGNEQTILVDDILNLDLVQDYNLTQTLSLDIALSLTELNPQYRDYLIQNQESFYHKSFTLDVIGIRDDLFMQYVDDKTELSSNTIPLMVLNQATFMDESKYSQLTLFDSIPSLSILNPDFSSYPFEVIGLTNHYPIGLQVSSPSYTISVLTKFSLVEQLMNDVKNVGGSNLGLYLLSDDSMRLEEEIINLYVENGLSSPNLVNFERYRQSEQQLIVLISVFSTGFITLISLISLVNVLNTMTTSIMLRTREFSMLRSMGMDLKSFNKMIRFESLFYGLKALLYGLPISLILILIIHQILQINFTIPLTIPWGSVVVAILGIFTFVSLCMLYSSSQVKQINLIEGLKQENL